MMNLRKRSVVMWIVLIAFIGGGAGFGAFGLFDALGGLFSKRTKNTLAIVNGEKIEYADYGMAYNRLAIEMGPEALEEMTTAERKELLKQAWEKAIEEAIWEKTIEREKVVVGEDELNLIVSYSPPPELLQDTVNWYVEGRFDYQKYQAMLNAPDLPIQTRQYLDYYKSEIARELIRSKVRGDLQHAFRITRNQYAEAQVYSGTEIVIEALFVYEMPEVDTVVSDSEIQAYYEENLDLFEREKWWELRMIGFPINPSPEDSSFLKQRIESVVPALKQGYEFEQMALDFTKDSSRVFTRPLETLSVEEYEELVKTPVGDVADPFFYRGAWHLTKILDRTEDEITYREVIVPLEAGDSTRMKLLDRIDEFRDRVNLKNLDSLVFQYGVRMKTGPYVRASKSVFLRDFPYNDIIKTYALSSKVGDISEPLPAYRNTFYVFFTWDIAKHAFVGLEDTVNVNFVKNRVILDRKKKAQEEYAQWLSEQILAGASYASLVGNPHVSIDTLFIHSFFEMEVRYGSRQAGACYYLKEGEKTGPVKCDVGYGFFRCLKREFDPTSQMVETGINNEHILMLNDLAEEVFYRGDVKDYRSAYNFMGTD
ncbi:peptidyl-prolyl cis-trans isomerase [candidate division WOR-3 bacterium]|nr:peptidyl-prolyl cis-trans isomerase [candidate division WOR-3 bacterium]